ncbi:MAG: helix-turn-helix domain-containing protein [Alphaproteobacteria bacterium]|nr:helix-turn-helix domain-containing protein [Alphaproteobacteria bacterium]
MSIKERRIQRGWSQEHLAQVTGLSARTIQRIEAGRKPGLDSLQALAAVFETDTATLIEEYTMTNTDSEAIEAYSYNAARQEEDEYVQNIKAFRLNAIIFCLIMPVMILINLTLSPSYLWVKWLALFWLASFVLHAFVIKLLFGVFDTKWEKRMAEEYRNRE